MPVDAATAAQRYAASSSFAPQRWTEGIQATQKQPGQLAAQAIQKYINNVNAAAQSGYTARRMQEGDARWKPNSLAKSTNYSNGLQQGQQAYQAGYGAFWSYMGPYWQQLQGMANNSDADAEARMLFWTRTSRQYQKP